MRFPTGAIVCALEAFFAAAAFAVDVIELKNGDRISGTIVFAWDYDTKPAHFREKSDFRYLGNVGWGF